MTSSEREHLDRLDRLVAAAERIADALEARPAQPADRLVNALSATFGDRNFTSAEVIAEAETQAELAQAAGLALPELPRELHAAGIGSGYALGRYLAGHDGVARIGQDRNGTLWRVNSREPKFAQTLRGISRAG